MNRIDLERRLRGLPLDTCDHITEDVANALLDAEGDRVLCGACSDAYFLGEFAASNRGCTYCGSVEVADTFAMTGTVSVGYETPALPDYVGQLDFITAYVCRGCRAVPGRVMDLFRQQKVDDLWIILRSWPVEYHADGDDVLCGMHPSHGIFREVRDIKCSSQHGSFWHCGLCNKADEVTWRDVVVELDEDHAIPVKGGKAVAGRLLVSPFVYLCNSCSVDWPESFVPVVRPSGGQSNEQAK